MVQKTDVKSYLHIPYDDDDEFIEIAIEQGYGYLDDAIDNFDELYASNNNFAAKADYWVLTQWIPPQYDKREGMASAEQTISYTARSMLGQLQCYVYEEVPPNEN